MTEIAANAGINYPYTAIDLTAQIARIPNTYGDLQQEGLFQSTFLSTTYVEIAFQDGQVTVLEADAPGRPGPVLGVESENGVILRIPHIPHKAVIKPKDLQDKFEFGSGRRVLKGVETATANALNGLRRNHGQTFELLRWGALKGVLASGKGATLYNFFQVFGVTKKVIDLKLDNPATDVLAKCQEIRQYVEVTLKGETMNGLRCKIDQSLFNKLVVHPNVEKFFIGHQAAMALVANIEKNEFPFGGIIWQVNNQVVSNIDGAPVKFIDAGKGIVYPTGTTNMFRTYYGAAHHIQMVNTVAPEIFVSAEVLPHGQGVELQSQSNPLPICQRPDLLVEVMSSPPTP
ncbi:MAG: major capsid protein [Alphaproteobacteria bacterium]|nr:major capsid protein [Alphaproteobacteria bacterium]